MTENKNPDIQTLPHPTWTVTAYRKGATWKVIAISPCRKHVLHKDKLTDEALKTYDPTAGVVKPNVVDFVSDLNAAKPSKAVK